MCYFEEGYKRDWRFGRRELSGVVERLCSEGDEGLIRREGFFGRRVEFIVVGVVLLEEIFEVLGIEEMEVLEYVLVEGVIVDFLGKVFGGLYDLNVNVRWRLVMRFVMWFNGKKWMNYVVYCVNIVKVLIVRY